MSSLQQHGAHCHLFFLLSLGLIICTGAAGMRAHHSLIRRRNFSVFCFLSGISLVYTSRTAIRSRCLQGTKIRNADAARNATATISVVFGTAANKTALNFRRTIFTDCRVSSNLDIASCKVKICSTGFLLGGVLTSSTPNNCSLPLYLCQSITTANAKKNEGNM